MKPIGPLMREHRLIERMIVCLDRQQRLLSQTNKVDVVSLMVAVDFIRTYADRTHHGKEEDILFRELAKKKLSAKDKRTMDELVEEHVRARQMVKRLVAAKDGYEGGNPGSLIQIAGGLKELVEFYPVHIAKEDKGFFYPSLEYFSNQEQDKMLLEFWEFDRKLIHEKYQGIVEEVEKHTR